MKRLLLAGLLSTVSLSFADDNKIKQLEEQIKLLQQQIEELKKIQEQNRITKEETEVLKEEIRQLKLENVIGELEVKSYYGLGPAASKAMFNKRGVSIGGYGELSFVHSDVDARGGAKNIANMQRFILYIGYAFNEKLKFNSEIELEHASTDSKHGTGGGYYKTELAFLDYNFTEKLGLRGGLLLVPVGIINEYHEPPTFPTAQRPFTETRIIPTTWEEMGFGIYGKIKDIEYKLYLTNGLMLKGAGDYNVLEPFKNIRQRGARAVADRYGITGRIDYNLPYNLKIGGSFWSGDVQSKGGTDSKLNLRRGSDIGNFTIISPHIWWQYKGFDIRAVATFVDIKDSLKMSKDLFGSNIQNGTTNINNILPTKQQAYYLQLAYDIFRLTTINTQELYLFGVYENIDTHKDVPAGYIKPPGHKLNVYNFGFSYKPHPLIAIKSDYVKLNYSDNKKDESLYRLTLGFMF